MTDIEACDIELGELAELVAALQGNAGEGEALDLSALSAKTESLCARIAALPEDANRALAPRIEALVGALDRLCAAIGARHRALLAQLAEAGGADARGYGPARS